MFGRYREGSNLEVLQRDSWQLELLVTGFALAGMISGLDEFQKWNSETLASLNGNGILTIVAGGILVCVSFAYLITLANFFFHVVLRCLWIGAIGSRSVMQTTVLQRRKLAPRFARFLTRRAGDIDGYIQRLDDTSSLVFAFTFLLIITAVSLFASSALLILLSFAIKSVNGHTGIIVALGLLITVIVLFGLLYLIDFLTVGWLKRFRWLSVVYYPFYRLFGWVTLARLYRPLYYNLLNRPRGRTVVLLLVPYLAIAFFFSTLGISPNVYVADAFLTEDQNSAFVMEPSHYADESSAREGYTEIIIPSQVLRASPLRVRIPILGSYEGYIERRCPNLPRHYDGSLHSDLFGTAKSVVYANDSIRETHRPTLSRETLDCLSSAVALYLDDRPVSMDDVLLTRPPDKAYSELLKFIDLDSLQPGLHELTMHQFKTPNRRSPLDTLLSVVAVPFYYAPTR